MKHTIRRERSVSEICLPWLAVFAGIFFLYLKAPLRYEDDMWFSTMFFGQYQNALLPYLRFRWETWSTRLILEALMMPLLRYRILFVLANAAWFTALAAAAAELLELKTDRQRGLLGVSLLLLPLSINARAGYVCTTINYVFTLACFLWAILPAVRRVRGAKVSWRQDARSVLLMILACNMEFYVPPFLLLSAGLAIYGIKKKKIHWLPVALTLIALLSGVYAALAPTNTSAAYAANGVFPGFDLLSTAEKLAMGLIATAGGLISTSRHGGSFFAGTLAVTAVLALSGWDKGKKLWKRLLCALPLAITAVIGAAARLAPQDSAMKALFYVKDPGWLCPAPGGGMAWLIPLAAAAVFFAALGACVWHLDRKLFAFYLSALFSRMIMGLSQAVYHSGLRTFYLVLFALCFAGGCAVTRLAGKRRLAAVFCLSAGAAYMTVVNILEIL